MGGAGDCITGDTAIVEPEAPLAELATFKPDTAPEEEEGVREGFSVATVDSVERESEKQKLKDEV